MTPVAEALRELVALLRSGLSLRASLQAWPDACPASIRDAARDVADRIRLGASPKRAASDARGDLAPFAAEISAVLALHDETGCDAAALLSGLAAEIDARAAMAQSAGASAAGSKLSGRLIAALPLGFVPLVAGSAGWRFDRRGSLLIVAGVAMLLAGLSWIARLVPRPRRTPLVVEVAERAAVALEAGMPLPLALESCANGAPLDDARRRVALGASWADALGASDDPSLRALAASLRRIEDLGVPGADALRTFAAAGREREAVAFAG